MNGQEGDRAVNGPLWSAEEAAAATGGRLTGAWGPITGISIDTRTLQAGDLFVALTDRRDGHDFVTAALAAGAAGALVARRPDGAAEDAPLLQVADVLDGLRALGRAARARMTGMVIAVTGSVGKTSTKEMLRHIARGQTRVHAAQASFNNHWGVPLTLARMPRDTGLAVVEIGMNHPGEITPLSRLACPHVAMITTVAPAHMAAFATVEDIARAKAEILSGLEPGGTAVLNADMPTLPVVQQALPAEAAAVLFGESAAAQWRALEIRLNGSGTTVRAATPMGTLLFRVGAVGRHFALNALGALAAVGAAGFDPVQAALALAGWRAPGGRGARHRVVLDAESGAGFELIDDAYNANPTSLAAALEVLAATEPTENEGRVGRGRRIAILGDMLELGAEEAALHAGIAALPQMEACDLVHCCGPLMRHLHDALPPDRRGLWAASAAELVAAAPQLVGVGDIVLVKGSNGSHVGRVVDALLKMGQAGPGDASGADRADERGT